MPDPPFFLPPPLLNKHMRKDLTPEERQLVLDYGLRNLQKGPDGGDEIDGRLILVRGTVKFLAGRFKVDKTTIQCIWNRALESYYNDDTYVFASLSRKLLTGYTRKYPREEIIAAIRGIPYRKRTTYRKLAAALALPKSTVFWIAKDNRENVIRPHTSAVKPMLSEEGKISRFMYCVNHLQLNHPDQEHPSPDVDFDPGLFGYYDGFYDQVHIDEKWFFVSEGKLKIYLAHGEEAPTRRTKHKEHIEKVMFLSAVTRPRFDDEKVCTFDGKIGIWPFVHQVAAQRSSIYRPAGTMETKSLPVTKQSYADMIVDNVLPMIKAKWPDGNKQIYLQHDNASTHFGSDFAPFVAAATDEEWDIRLTKQPANSPDLNINVLSFLGHYSQVNGTLWKKPTTTSTV